MKQMWLGIACLLLGGSLHAKASMEESKPRFFQNLDWSAEYFTSGKADFKGDSFSGESMKFSEGEVSISYEEPMQKEELSVLADLGFRNARLRWKENPFFKQEDFKSILAKLALAYPFDDHWTWQLGAGADFQTSPSGLSKYTSYAVFLWGRYAYDEERLFNIGVVSWLGMKDHRVYPILGINYNWNEQWMLNLVFPFMGSLTYMIDEQWGAELSLRWMQLRKRLKKEEALSKGIFEYSSKAAQLGVFYNLPIGLVVKVFGGVGFGTELEVYNEHGKDKQRFKMKSPTFFGVSIDCGY